MSVRLPLRDQHLAQQAAEFAEKITPAKERWEYAYSRATYGAYSPKYGGYRATNARTIPVAARLLGVSDNRVRLNLTYIGRDGFDAAMQQASERPYAAASGDRFAVGPMQAWHVGHIYFAHVESHPHVVKVGFSRRVRERLDDIQARCRTKVTVAVDGLRAGTLADEHWWHRSWSSTRIAGEWFFDPRTSDRSLPSFLSDQVKSEAA